MFVETEYKSIIDRKKNIDDFNNYFSDLKNLFKDIVNYGSNLIPRCLTTSDRRLEDSIILGVLLRQVISMLDGAELLISNAAVHSSHLQVRAAFEASLFIEWLLLGEAEKKAKYFYVANLRQDKLWAERTLGQSSDHQQFEKITKELSDDMLKDMDGLKDQARNQLAEINRLLSEFSDIDDDFENFKSRRGLSYEPNWYNVLGISSIRQLAKEVGRLADYQFFYSWTSGVMHTTRDHHHIQLGDGKVRIHPIRSLEKIQLLSLYILSVSFRTYYNVLNHYRPNEIEAFKRKYTEAWHQTFRSIRAVKYYPENENPVL